MHTSQLQRLHKKSWNSKRNHKQRLYPECITPTQMTSNLLINTERIKSEREIYFISLKEKEKKKQNTH